MNKAKRRDDGHQFLVSWDSGQLAFDVVFGTSNIEPIIAHRACSVSLRQRGS
jgi:hypothetical protein